jgi:uncharacterized LabA/DUF88 family protein
MRTEPKSKRAICFFDGQNFFHLVRTAFGFGYPNYDVKRLANAVCKSRDWIVSGIRFYTGVPPHSDDPYWRVFWDNKLKQMKADGIETFHRDLVYHTEEIPLRECKKVVVQGCKGVELVQKRGRAVLRVRTRREKGIDVRIAVDVVHLANARELDVAVIFSQDQDFTEVAKEVRAISSAQDRWIKIASAFPLNASEPARNFGINLTDMIPIEWDTYKSCIDHRDYRVRT